MTGGVAPTAAGRRLIVVPIVHTEADLGSLAAEVARARAARHGTEHVARHRLQVAKLWGRIARWIDRRELPPARMKIYQDSLPVCGREIDLVRELAEQGSVNHLLVRRLVHAGGTLVGTEDPELLIAEYRRHLAGEPEDDTLLARDRAIAARIDATLGPGETGVLFIGLMHDVAPHLAADIGVETCDLGELLTERS